MRFRSIRKYVYNCVLNDIQMTRAARATQATPRHSKQLKETKKKKLEAEKRKNNLKGRNRS